MKTIFSLDKNIRFDPTANELQFLTNGKIQYYEAVKIENRLSKILYLLLTNANEVINRTYFVEVIWEGNANVGNPALTKSISSLRSILKKHQPGSEQLIETIPKIGYRIRMENSISYETPKKENVYYKYPVILKVKTWHLIILSIILFYLVKLILNGSFHAMGHHISH